MSSSQIAPQSFGDRIGAHAEAEQYAISRYRQLAGECPDQLVSHLMQLILEDEAHHHAALRRMASILDRDNSAVESLSQSFQLSPDAADELEGFAREEREGAAELRQLALEAGAAAEGLMKLALELMARDSEKHALILRFAAERLRAGAQPPG
jgi:rubrerythrin